MTEPVTQTPVPTMSGIDMFLYLVDNEIDHRGRGDVHARSLGVRPPSLPER